ncbi:MAG: polysaccharide deacetylase family protein [Chloroflexota bacterium]|nr:polysaccharide deacetylase family protein [Chloroflexota bacterium]
MAAATRGRLAGSTAGLLDHAIPRRRGILTVLTYHRVDEPDARPDLMPTLISATPATFAKQVAFLARHFEPVSLADVLEALEQPELLPRRAVLVTFDDAYRDFATHAWPVLRTAAVPATLFVPTAFPYDPTLTFWWARLWAAIRDGAPGASVTTPAGALQVGPERARDTVASIRTWLKSLDHDEAMRELERLVARIPSGPALEDPASTSTTREPAVLGWDELRRLAGEGVTLAPHTRHHPLLDRVPIERAVDEIVGSHADLERELASAVPRVLAYPSGAHDGSAVEAARRAGMDLAMTTRRGGNDLRTADRWRLRRINVGSRAGVPLLRAQLAWAAAIDARRAPA